MRPLSGVYPAGRGPESDWWSRAEHGGDRPGGSELTRVAQGEVIVMAGPAQVERPASGGGEVDDRRAGAAGDLPGHGLVRAVERGPDTERRQYPFIHPGDPEDLVAHVRQRGNVQRIVLCTAA